MRSGFVQRVKSVLTAEKPWQADLLVAFFACLIPLIYLWQVVADPLVQEPILDLLHYQRVAESIADGTFDSAFFVDPLYLLMRAGTLALFGPGIGVPIALNIVALALACLALRRVAARVGGPLVGVLAALLLPLCQPLLFYQVFPMKETMALALMLWSFVAFLKAWDKPTPRIAGGAGALFGLAVLCRGNLQAMVPVLLVSLWLRGGNSGSWRGIGAGSFGLGLVLVILPITVWNYSASNTFVPITYNLGNNFYQGNNPHHQGTDFYNPPFTGDNPLQEEQGWRGKMAEIVNERCGPECTPVQPEQISPTELSRFWLRRGLDHVWDAPGLFVSRSGRKLLRLMSNSEITNNIPVQYMRGESSFLNIFTYGFGSLVVLGILGCGLAWRRLRPHLWLLASGGLYTLVVSVFYIITRLKIPMVPILLIPAVMGLQHLWSLRGTRLLPVAAVVCLLSIMAFWPYQDRVGTGHYNRALILEARGEMERAAQDLEQSIKGDPNFYPAYLRLVDVRLRLGSAGPAEAALVRLERRIGQVPEGRVTRQPAVRNRVGGGYYKLCKGAKDLEAKTRVCDRARRYFQEAFEGFDVAREKAAAAESVGLTFATEQRYSESIEWFERAWSVGASPEIAKHRALAYFLKGDEAQALRATDEGLVRFPKHEELRLFKQTLQQQMKQ